MDHFILLALVKITIFSLMLAIGINLSLAQLLSFWRRPDFLIRALLAVIVLVPLVVIIVLKVFNLPPDVSMGLSLLAVSPGAPLITKRAQMAGVNIFEAAGLQLTLALTAVVVTPLTLDIFYALFTLKTEKLSVLEVSRQISLTQLLPVAIGLAVQRFLPKLVLRIGKPLNAISTILFLIVVGLFLIPALRSTIYIGIPSIIAIIIMVIISLAIGHYLGGPDLEQRSVLAIACIARNVGLALFIAVLNDAEKSAFPVLFAYAILGAIVALPYSKWVKKELAQQKYKQLSQ